MPNPHPKTENLKPYKKGQSGNPKGKPPGTRSLTTLLRESLVKIGEGQQEPYDTLLVKRVMKMAVAEGNEAMIKLVWGYLEGLPIAKTELSGKDGGPIVIDSTAQAKIDAALTKFFNASKPAKNSKNK